MTSGGRDGGWRRRAQLYHRLAPCYDQLIAPVEKLLPADARLWPAHIGTQRWSARGADRRGRLVLIEHSISSWRAIAALQRLIERWSAPRFGEHLTRQPEALAAEAGFTIVHAETRLGGVVRRVIASPR